MRRFITLGIPAYGRPSELCELLESVTHQTVLPQEIVICEDASPERNAIRDVVESKKAWFDERGCVVRYIENPINLGYDGNVRKVIFEAVGQWVMLIGNDDLLLDSAIERAQKFVIDHPGVHAVSRSVVRFSDSARRPISISRFALRDRNFSFSNSKPRMAFRLGAFVGGLLFESAWARSHATDAYDGGLFYQIVLMEHAFLQGGIGYIADPTVAGRVGHPPLFGSSRAERGVHFPGSYTPSARAAMWRSVIKISEDIEALYGVALVRDISRELMVRQSFHVFEMYLGSGKPELLRLKKELNDVGLYGHWFPKCLFWVVYFGGYRARYLFSLSRTVFQR